jgi:hypothetical protein
MGGPHRSSYANYVLLLRDNGDPAWSFRENGMYVRAATVNFCQARPPHWRPHQWRATAAAAAFYSAKSRRGLASRGGPVCILHST